MRRIALGIFLAAAVSALSAQAAGSLPGTTSAPAAGTMNAAAPVASPAPPASSPPPPAAASPAPARAILDDDPAAILGLAVPAAIVRYGPPDSVYAVRGDEPWQDDVAFRYASGFTLFMYGDRLWQLRLAAPYAGSIYGLFLGDPADKAYSLLGEPYERSELSLVYRMPYRGYPVRLRLDLVDGKLADIYVYRDDF